MPDYKYKTSIVIGHRRTAGRSRKYIQDNSKMRFEAKVRQVRALTERGGAPARRPSRSGRGSGSAVTKRRASVRPSASITKRTSGCALLRRSARSRSRT